MGKYKEMTRDELIQLVLKNERGVAKLKDDLITIGVLMEVIGKRLCDAGKKLKEAKDAD